MPHVQKGVRFHLAQVSPLLAQAPAQMAQVRFYGQGLRRKMPFYALQWRRLPTQNRTCAKSADTCTK